MDNISKKSIFTKEEQASNMNSLAQMRLTDISAARDILNDITLIDKAKIAQMMNMSQPGVSDMIARYEKKKKGEDLKFPDPIIICDKKYYFAEEVKEWAGIFGRRVKRNVHLSLNGRKIRICLWGQPGAGKSLSWTIYSINGHLMRKIVSKNGSAYTETVMHITFSSKISDDFFRIVSESNEFESGLMIVDQDNYETIKGNLETFNEYIRECRENNNYDPEKEYIEFFLKPSEQCMDILEKLNISQLEFIDTPGIDEQHRGESLVSADMIVLFLANRGRVDDIVKVIKPILPYSASSNILYIYNACNGPVTSIEDYENLKKSICNGPMTEYEDDLKELQNDSVILNSIEMLDPKQHCIPFPQISSELTPEAFYPMLEYGEKLFAEQFSNAIIDNFKKTSLDKIVDNFKENEFNEIEDYFTSLIKNSINDLNEQYFDSIKHYTKEDFTGNKHGRTKDKDNYEVVYSLYSTRKELLNRLYDEFLKFKTSDCNDLKLKSIKLAYTLLTRAVRSGYKYGYGTHPFEDYLCETQMIEEAICADDLVDEDLSLKNRYDYAKTLINNSIYSESWNYVYVHKDVCSCDKLRIIKDYSLYRCNAKNMNALIYGTHFKSVFAIEYMKTIFRIRKENVEDSNYENNRKLLYNKILK